MLSGKTESATALKTRGCCIASRGIAFLALFLVLMPATAALGAEKSAAAIENTQLFIPASAHVTGALGTNWRTDLEVFNPGQSPASVTVALLKAGMANTNPQTKTYNLEPGESMRFEDALMSVFNFDGAAAIRIVNTVGMAAVTSRTYNLTSSGTYGQFVGGVISHTAIQAGQQGRIIQLTHNRSASSGFRTNIGFVNATGSQITVQVALYRANGTYLGSKSYPLGAYEFQQVDKIFQKVTDDDVADGYAVLTTTTTGGAFFAYGVVIDNRTSDPVYITPANRAASGSPPPPTTTPTPTTTRTPTPTPTPTPTATPTASLNLAPYQPPGWSGPLVASGTTGTRTSGGLSGSGPTYFDWAVANYGPDDAVFPAGSNIARILLDNTTLVSFYSDSALNLESTTYASYDDYEVNGITSGSHTARLVGDPDNVIGETSETDNTYDYMGTWSTKSAGEEIRVMVPKARIRIAPIPGWKSGASETYHTIGIRWEGEPPLEPGPVAVAHAKATTPDNAIYIPAAAHASGALNTNWRTDVQLHNPGTVQARVNVAMLVRDQANPSPQTRTFTINAGTSVRLQDILASSFSFDGAAALRISILQGDVIATSRTYNLTSGGTYGQFAATIHGSQAFATGERALLMQLTHNNSTTSGFRTNVGMVNLSDQTINLDLDLRSAAGTSYGTRSYPLRPYEFIQKDKIFKSVTSGDVNDGYIVMTSQSAGARFLAYATVIDNQTGDTVFIPAISVLAAEPAAASFIPAAEAAFSAMGLFGQGTLPNLETIVGTVQSVGMPGIIAAAAALLPPGTLTPLPNGWRADLGSHFVAARTGDILAGSVTGTYANLVNQPGQLSYDYEITGEDVMWNGQYAEIGGATGDVDLDIDNQGHVSGGVTMESFPLAAGKNGKTASGVTVTGSAEFDTEVCGNYPISGSVTVTKDGESQTITFTNDCDGTFEGGSQGQTGDVSFRLTWSGPQDLDLYVIEPSGELIYFGHSTSATHGELDVDSNAGCGSPSPSPTENVFWPEGSAPHGTYTFYARRWSACSATTTPAFTLRVFEGSTVVRTINGTMPEGGETEHYTHVY
jgi:hypothetical protein